MRKNKMNPEKIFRTGYRILLLIIFVVTCHFIYGCGKEKREVHRIGILSGAKTFESIADGFMYKMSELGYVEGKNIVYDYKKAHFDMDAYRKILEGFANNNVNLILAFPTEPALVAKTITKGKNIPIVFAMAGIEKNELIDSISSPGKNITGVRYPGPETTVRRLDILIELVPKSKRIYIIYDKNYPTTLMALGGLRSAALSLGLALVEDPVNDLNELKSKLKKRSVLSDIGIDAILIMPDILNNSPDGFNEILKFANENKLPIGGGMDFTADLGALFSYVPDNFEQGKLAATLAHKILNGTPAEKIMVITPPAKLRINYKVIRELDLKVSEGLLSGADEIIR
jgi:putative ABC transport system substrate-binding protein